MVMLVVMLVLCGCGTRQKLPARKTDGKIKIGVSVYDQYDAFVAELMQDLNDQVLGAKAEEKQDIVLEVYNAAQSQTKQNEQVRDMIAANFDVICVNLVDRTAPTEVINAARDADVPIIFFNRELVEDDLQRWDKLFYVGADAFVSGKMQGELAVDAIQSGTVDLNIQYTGSSTAPYAVGIYTGESGNQSGKVTVGADAAVHAAVTSGQYGSSAKGIWAKGDVALNGETSLRLTYPGTGSPSNNWTS